MFKLEHHEAIMLLQIIEANQFQGKDIPLVAKLMEKLIKEMKKTAPLNPDEKGWVDGQK